MAPQSKRGRPHGTTKDDTKGGVVRFRCDLEQKGRWVAKARAKGQTLTEWIIARLEG